MAKERVKIYHEDLPETRTKPVSVTRQSFDRTWSKPHKSRKKGWKLWNEKVAAPAEKKGS